MKVTKAMQKAGIASIDAKNSNGSYHATVVLDKVLDKFSYNFRETDQSHIDEIKARFNPLAVQNPTLHWDGKKLASINGNHTIAVLKLEGHDTYTAELFVNLAHEQIAAIFHDRTQYSKRMGPWDAYAAALEAKFKYATDIQAGLDRHGFSTPNTEGFNNRTADFTGFTGLLESWQYGSSKFLNSFLTVLKVWKGERLHKAAQRNAFQRGLIDFLKEYTLEYSDRDLAGLLGRRGAHEITERADDLGNTWRTDRKHFKLAFQSVLSIGQSRRLAA